MKVATFSNLEEAKLDSAVLIYSDRSRGAAFASVHPIEVTKGKPRILPGQAASRHALRELLRGLETTKAVASDALFPPGLLGRGDGWMVWWSPPGKRTMWFDCDDEVLGVRFGMTPHPGLVWMVREDLNAWWVFGVADDLRPTPTTRLYHSAFFNVGDKGDVCLGSMPTPEPFTIEKCEEAFFASRFTHPNGQRRKIDYRRGFHAFWKSQVGSKRRFPTERLVPIGMTVAQAFDMVMGKEVQHGRG